MWQSEEGWQANIHATLNTNSSGVPISPAKAALLAGTLRQDQCYFLTLQAGFDVEIVRLLAVTQNILIIERAQQGTCANIWPAGTLLVARIPAKILSELRIDKNQMLSLNQEMREAPNGDVITKL
ncbi:MAG TPA: hypothetical protein VI522_07940 [Gammaproteobacteria bacterium]|nr:hypothetical protein [Gammaproteobacteria bacterium]